MGLSLANKYGLKISEAAEYFGIGEGTLRALLSAKEMEKYVLKIGNRSIVKRKMLEEYLNTVDII